MTDDAPTTTPSALPPGVVFTFASPTSTSCGVRAEKDAPECGQPPAYRAEVPATWSGRSGRTSSVLACEEHKTYARAMPDLISIRSV